MGVLKVFWVEGVEGGGEKKESRSQVKLWSEEVPHGKSESALR